MQDQSPDQSMEKEQMAEETVTKLRDVSEDLQERASAIFDQASGWIDKNRTLAMAGTMFAIGMLGFFIGRATATQKPES